MRDIDQLAAHVVASGVAVDMRIEGSDLSFPQESISVRIAPFRSLDERDETRQRHQSYGRGALQRHRIGSRSMTTATK
jgi:hypothetical protein